MKCEQVCEALDAFLNGDMSGEASREMRRHLASCAACARRLQDLEWIEILPALDEEVEPTESFAARFQQKLQRRKAESGSGRAAQRAGRFSCLARSPWRLAVAGALAALVVAGVFLRHPGDEPGSAESWSYLPVAENLSLFQDMAVVDHLDFLENFEAIETLTLRLEGSKEKRLDP